MAAPQPGAPCSLASPRLRSRPTPSSRPPASRRPLASSRKPPLPARSIISAASRKTSSWAGSFLPALVSNITSIQLLTEMPAPAPVEELPEAAEFAAADEAAGLDFLGGAKEADPETDAATEGQD